MKRGSSADLEPEPPAGGRNWTLWLWVGAGFLCLGLLWFIMFRVAHSAQIREVPLASQGGRP